MCVALFGTRSNARRKEEDGFFDAKLENGIVLKVKQTTETRKILIRL